MTAIGNAGRQIRDHVLRARSIRVLVTPTPITFAERQSVLQVLEQYGPIETFRMSPGYYSSFISLTKETMTAEKLVASSPLTYNLPEVVRNASDDLYIADLNEPESFSHNQPTVTEEKGNKVTAMASSGRQDFRSDGEKLVQKQFQLEIFPAPEYKHRFATAGSPLHGSWPRAYKDDQSLMTMILKQTLPRTTTGRGLAHWLVNVGSASRLDRAVKRLQLKEWLPSRIKSQHLKKMD